MIRAVSVIRICLACLCLAWCAPSVGEEDAEAPVVVKEVAAAEVAYWVHEGPPWGLGATFEKVAALQEQAGQSGPLFARYLVPGRSRGADGGEQWKTEIGFFVNKVVEFGEDIARGTIPQHDAATLVIEAPFGMLSEYHDRLYEWIEREEYIAVGPLMEIYSTTKPDRRTVEIRVPVRRDASPEISVAADVPELAEIAARGDYEELAALVIPEGDASAPEHRRWMSDVMDRLRVIREIANKKYGSDGTSVVLLLEPILERGKAIPRLPAARDGDGGRGAFGKLAEKKRSILKDLDRLMVKAHLKVISANELAAELIRSLERVRGVTATPAAIRPPESESDAAEEAGGL